MHESLHCDVPFVFSEAEVRKLDLTARILLLENLNLPRRPSALTVILRWRVFRQDSYDNRLEPTASSARLRFGRTFRTGDYALTRAGDNAVRVESAPTLYHSVTFDMVTPGPSAVTSADVPHGLAVPPPPVALFFGTLPLHAEGYTAAMFARLVTFKWFWQIGNSALHEAVRHGRIWLIESEVTRKRSRAVASLSSERAPGASPYV